MIVVALLLLFMFAPPSVSLLVSATGAVLLFRAARIRLAKWRGDPVPVARERPGAPARHRAWTVKDDYAWTVLEEYAQEHTRQAQEDQRVSDMQQQEMAHLYWLAQEAQHQAAQDWD